MKYFVGLIFFFFGHIIAAQKAEAPVDTPEPGTTEAIAKATTDT